jgi:hypothetical protein
VVCDSRYMQCPAEIKLFRPASSEKIWNMLYSP